MRGESGIKGLIITRSFSPKSSHVAQFAYFLHNVVKWFLKVMAVIFFLVFILIMRYVFLNLIVGMVINMIEPAIAQVKREDWEAAEAEEEGAGGPPEPEVKALLARLATQRSP